MGQFSSTMVPGRVDKKYIALLGLGDNTSGEKFMLPVGTFLLSSSNGDVQNGRKTQGGHCYDIVHEFGFTINDDFPHTLYGQQDASVNPRYDPAYNLTNAGDNQTWYCDAVAFMTQASDNVFFSSDFQSLFAYIGNNLGVNVYAGSGPGGTHGYKKSGSTEYGLDPIPQNDPTWGYNWAPDTGTVIFKNPHTESDLIISVDGKPQGMSPENMLKHLFVDYAGYDPAYLMFLDPNFQQSNVVLPVYVGGRDKALWAIAQDIANMTAPRCVAYIIRIDELGQVQFYESKTTATPTETLVDTRDILDMSYTYTDEQLVNVVRGDCRSNDNQPVTSIAYDIQSINDNGQREPYDLPDELMLSTRGMNSYYAVSFLNMMTASILFKNSQPILQLTLDVLPNPMRQVGDKINIVSSTTGNVSVYTMQGINDTISKGQYKQQLRCQKAKLFNNFAMGMPTALTNDSSQQTVDQNANALAGQTGLLDNISIGGTQCFANGQQKLDDSGEPIISIVTGDSWDFEYSIQKTQAYDTYVWRYWYLESQNSRTASDLMVMREKPWMTSDGVIIGHAKIAAGYSDTTTHSSGSNLGTGTGYLRSNIIVAPAIEMLPFGYKGAFTKITFAAFDGALSGLTADVGLALGSSFTGNWSYFPMNKINYGYFCILVVNRQGAIQFTQMPFELRL